MPWICGLVQEENMVPCYSAALTCTFSGSLHWSLWEKTSTMRDEQQVRKARWPIQWDFTRPDVSPTCRHCCYVFIHTTKYHTLLTCIHTYYMNSPSLPPSKKNNLSVVILKLEIESKTIRKGILRWHFTCDLWWWQGGATRLLKEGQRMKLCLVSPLSLEETLAMIPTVKVPVFTLWGNLEWIVTDNMVCQIIFLAFESWSLEFHTSDFRPPPIIVKLCN